MFYAYTEGSGEGCDYTIGCNLCVERLNATTMDAAIAEAVGDTWSARDDERVERVTVLRVTEEVDCGDRIAALRAARVAEEQGEVQALKRAQLEHLKRKLGEA